jgi:hypothetical protein
MPHPHNRKPLYPGLQVDIVDEPQTAQLCPHSDQVTIDIGSGASAISGTATTPTPSAQLAVTVGVARARGSKCARCWNYSEAVGAADGTTMYPDVCERCRPVLAAMDFTLPPTENAAVATAAKAAVAAV